MNEQSWQSKWCWRLMTFIVTIGLITMFLSMYYVYWLIGHGGGQ